MENLSIGNKFSYVSPTKKTLDELHSDLMEMYNRYSDEFQEDGFDAMVDLVAHDELYRLHLVAWKYRILKKNVIDDDGGL